MKMFRVYLLAKKVTINIICKIKSKSLIIGDDEMINENRKLFQYTAKKKKKKTKNI